MCWMDGNFQCDMLCTVKTHLGHQNGEQETLCRLLIRNFVVIGLKMASLVSRPAPNLVGNYYPRLNFIDVRTKVMMVS